MSILFDLNDLTDEESDDYHQVFIGAFLWEKLPKIDFFGFITLMTGILIVLNSIKLGLCPDLGKIFRTKASSNEQKQVVKIVIQCCCLVFYGKSSWI